MLIHKHTCLSSRALLCISCLEFLTWNPESQVLVLSLNYHRFSSVQVQSCLTLCDPMDCSTPGFPVQHARACSNSCPSTWWCHSIISSSVVPFSSCLQSFPASGSFPMSHFIAAITNSLYSKWPSLPWGHHSLFDKLGEYSLFFFFKILKINLNMGVKPSCGK